MLPRLIPASSDWTYADPLLTVTLTFGETMDQTTKAPPGDFVLVVDDVEKIPISTIWDDANDFTMTYSEATLGAAVVRCRYSAKNPLMLSVLGELVTPFDILVTAP